MPASWTSRTVTNDHILPYIDSNAPSTPPASRAALRTLPFERNVFKLLANSPHFFPPFMSLLSAAFSSHKAIRPSDWQLAVLLTARHLDAPYVWDVNFPIAKQLPPFQPIATYEPLLAARDLSSVELFTERQRLIGRFCEEIHGRENRVGEATMRGMKEGGFSDGEIMELFMVTGIYGMIARMMVSAKIDFDEEISGLDGLLAKVLVGDIEREEKLKKEGEDGVAKA